MFQTLKNAWNVPDLRKRILYTIFFLLVFRFGTHIPVPGIDAQSIANIVGNQPGGFLEFYDAISGGSFSHFSIFAMSITPYINASIILQLLTIAIPSLEKMAKEGEEGRKKIAQWTRYGTVILGLIQAVGLAISFKGYLFENSLITYIVVALSLTAGTAFIMWLGEQMTEFGVGNGISIIIFAGIISRIPNAATVLYQKAATGIFQSGVVLLLLALMIVIIALVVYVQQAERKIPVQYAKRVVGRKMYGGQSTHIPVKVSLAGVMPIIFAMSFLTFPSMLIQFFNPNVSSGFWYVVKNVFSIGSKAGIQYTIINVLLYSLLIFGFTFFYTSIVFNPDEIANTLKKNGGFIPGIRAGKPTSEYIRNVSNRVTVIGSLFIMLIAVMPIIFQNMTDIQIYFGGTALLIVVGVALDIMKQLESQLVMRHYKGFLE